MSKSNKHDVTGSSECSLGDAISNALQKAGTHRHYLIIETRSSLLPDDSRHYQVTLTLKGVL